MEKHDKESEVRNQQLEALVEECRRILAENESSFQFRIAVSVCCPNVVISEKE